MNAQFRRLLTLAVALFAIATSCHSIDHSPEPHSSKGEQTVHWNYGGPHNPTRWGELSPEYWTCGAGNNQSPVDLKASKTVPGASRIAFQYQPTPLEIINNGHTVQVNYAPGSDAQIDGKSYELKQFHFHTPSEHTVDGKASAMELHLVHQNEAGEFAVVGVLIAEGEDNPNLTPIWRHIPREGETKTVRGQTVDARSLLPPTTEHYHYSGSLTTPPCSEGVDWTVMAEPIAASTAQIGEFMEIYPVNSRPIQATGDREIVRVE